MLNRAFVYKWFPQFAHFSLPPLSLRNLLAVWGPNLNPDSSSFKPVFCIFSNVLIALGEAHTAVNRNQRLPLTGFCHSTPHCWCTWFSFFDIKKGRWLQIHFQYSAAGDFVFSAKWVWCVYVFKISSWRSNIYNGYKLEHENCTRWSPMWKYSVSALPKRGSNDSAVIVLIWILLNGEKK